MKFSFKIEDLAGLALVLLAGLLIYVGMTQAKTRQHSSARPAQPTHTVQDLPRIVPTSRGNGRGGAAKLPVSREPNKGQLFKIGIIDTGYDKRLDDMKMHICATGSFDFGRGTPTVGTSHWHGTAVAKAIAEQLDDVNYCFVFYQVAGPLGISAENLAAALSMASREGLVAVNVSLEGSQYSFVEKNDIIKLTARGTALFVAAGNRHENLDTACMSYPACYGGPNVYVVGATEDQGQYVAHYSNYGSKVSVWKDGSVEFQGSTAHGTSFASPKALGDYVHSLSLVAQ